MKKTIRFIVSFGLVLCMMMSMCIFANAEAPKKPANIQGVSKGDVLEAVKYDVLSDAYVYGSFKITEQKNEKGTYLVIDESSFIETEGVITDATKEKIKNIEKAVNTVFENRKNEINLSRFGRVDSEAAEYSLTVAPYAVPMLEELGMKKQDNIWLAMGNRAGKVLSVYINVSEADSIVPVVPSGKTATVNVVTPKRMSIRLADGTVLKNGDSFKAKIGETVYFAMCSNNWANDTYDDNGNGIMGTVVYSVTVADSYTERSYDPDSHAFVIPKGDLTLRTDTNRCFMAYRFYFEKAQYNKQTGIMQVVDPALESLSVNLPLGSTITADAYIAHVWKTNANVFIETAPDKTLSYTNYIWEGL